MESLLELYYKKFNPEVIDLANTKRLHTAVRTGPIGRADSYQLLAEDGQNAWHIAQRTPPVKNKHIIFADPILALRPKLGAEIDLWDTLTEQSAVYVWQGSDKAMRDQTPVSNLREFREQIKTVKPEFKKDIATSLVAQGLNLDEFIILDTVEYYRFLEPWQKNMDHWTSTQMDNVFRLLFTVETIEQTPYAPSLGKAIKALSSPEMKYRFASTPQKGLNQYPRLAEIDLALMSQSSKKDFFDLLRAHSDHSFEKIKLTLYEESIAGGLVFPSTTVQSIVLEAFLEQDLQRVDLSQLIGCESVTLRKQIPKFENICFPPDLRHLVFEDIRKSIGLYEVPAHLESLSIDPSYCVFDAERNRALRSLKLIKTADGQVGDQEVNLDGLQLTSLEVSGRVLNDDLSVINLSASLTTLSLKRLNRMPDISMCRNLQSLTIEGLPLPDLRSCTHLQSLTLINVSGMDLGKLPSNLRSLEVVGHIVAEVKLDWDDDDDDDNHRTGPFNLSSSHIKTASGFSSRNPTLSSRKTSPILRWDLTRFNQLLSLKLNIPNLTGLTGISKTVNKLDIEGYSIKEGLDISGLHQLDILQLRGVNVETKLPPRVKHISLKNCSLSNNDNLSSSLNLGELECNYLCLELSISTRQVILPASMHELVLSQAYGLVTIDFNNNTELTNLSIVGCWELATLPVLPSSLEGLYLGGNHKLIEPSIGHLQNLLTYQAKHNKSSPKPPSQSAYMAPYSLSEHGGLGGYPSSYSNALSIYEYIQYATNSSASSRPQKKNNSTALVNFESSEQPDSLTHHSSMSTDYSNNKMRVTLYTKKGVDKDQYRINVFDAIKIEGNRLSFIAELDDLQRITMATQHYESQRTAMLLKQQADNQPGRVAAEVEVALSPGMRFPLGTLHGLPSTDCLTVYTNCADLIFYWKEKTKQCFVQLAESAREQIVIIAYTYFTSAPYVIPPRLNVSQQLLKSAPRLNPEFAKRLESAIQGTPKLAEFMCNEELSVSEKIIRLAKYCASFVNEESTLPTNAPTADIVIDNLRNHRGSCRHRAQSFMVLAHYLGIEAALNANEGHMFAEFILIEKGVPVLRAFDFGGPDLLDSTPLSKRGADPFADKPQPGQSAVASLPVKHRKRFSLIETIDSFHSLLSANSPQSPLVMLPRNADPIRINQRIMAEIKAMGIDPMEDHLYIHSPTDFIRSMKAIRIADGQRTSVSGPLQRLLKEGGVLVINWDLMDATQMASFKSILERQGTFMGEPVSPKLCIISFISRGSYKACEAFLTRTKLYHLNPKYCNESPSADIAQGAPTKGLEIDLFELPNWRERLLGRVSYEGHAIRLHDDGALINAILHGLPLTIFNAPNESELHALLKRITSEGKLFFNGKSTQVHNAFKVVFQTRDNPMQCANVTVSNTIMTGQQPPIMLNANNLHECFRRQRVDNTNHSISHAVGWFDQSTDFLISDFISKSEWQELISHAQRFPENTFRFSLMPGAEIEGLMNAPHKIGEQPHSQVLFSNDPDFLVEQLKMSATNPLVIDVTPTTSYQELIALLIDARKEDGRIAFTHEPQGMLLALLAGRTVLLNGAINQVLYQQLLPILCSGKSQVYSNGEALDIKGRLHLIMPYSAKEALAPCEYASRDYTYEEYRPYFPASQQELIRKIEHFYRAASQLPHTGLGQPEAPKLTYQSLYRLVRQLSKPALSQLHQNNPIKGLFHYDYPKTSRNYAYLNVMAKCYFATDPQKIEDRSAKLARLVAKHHIQSRAEVIRYCWELTNCCDLPTAQRLFAGATALTLSDAGIDELYALIQSAQNSLVATRKNTFEEKAYRNVQALLKDEDKPTIVLKGAPGSGKSHTIRRLQEQLPEGHYHRGAEQLVAWMTTIPKGEEPIVLHLDEANMELPGTWDILKALHRKERTLCAKGKTYPLTKQFKVIATMNDETLPGRYFHLFFRNYAETVHYALPLEHWIKDHIMAKTMKPFAKDAQTNETLYALFLWAFYHVNEYNPHLELSLRDINSLMCRFKLLAQSENCLKEAARKACLSEFSAAIPNSEKRAKYIKAVNEQAGLLTESVIEKPIRVIGDLVVPGSKQSIIESIEQDLLICQHAGQSTKYRRGVLLEGSSGVGKSSVYKALLEEHGFSKNSPDPKTRYYEISVDNSDKVPYILIKAFLEGSKVVLDELNLNQDLEGLLNDLLDGVMPTDVRYQKIIKTIAQVDNPIPELGFQLFASQNEGVMKGRKALSPALRNRFHMIYVDNYSRDELVTILEHCQIPQAETVVDDFLFERSQNPDMVNTRNVFEWMKDQPKSHFDLA